MIAINEKFWLHHFQKADKRNYPMGENSPNLVTLPHMQNLQKCFGGPNVQCSTLIESRGFISKARFSK
jgi:hypothetical protein